MKNLKSISNVFIGIFQSTKNLSLKRFLLITVSNGVYKNMFETQAQFYM